MANYYKVEHDVTLTIKFEEVSITIKTHDPWLWIWVLPWHLLMVFSNSWYSLVKGQLERQGGYKNTEFSKKENDNLIVDLSVCHESCD